MAGMKHCGKSTHGRALAHHWGCAFYDTDELILEDHYALTGERLTIRDFFQKAGEEEFRETEARVFRQLCRSIEDEPRHAVIAVGGRLAVNPLVHDLLRSFGFFVFIRTDLRVLFDRVMRRGRPPFLREDDPFGDFLELYQQREPAYLEYADLVIDLEDVPVAEGRRIVISSVEDAVHAGKQLR